MVLNNLEWGIKHVDSLSTLRFLIEDAPFKDIIWLLPVATVSELSKLKNDYATSVEVLSLSCSGKILLHFLLCMNCFSIFLGCFSLIKVIS